MPTSRVPGPFYCYAYKITVEDGSFIHPDRADEVSSGNSGACIELQDGAGNVLLGGGIEFPVGTPMRTDILIATTTGSRR